MDQKARKKSKAWIPFVLIIAAALVFLGYRGYTLAAGGKISAKADAAAAETREESVFAVNTTFARAGELKEYLNINGDVIATETVDVYPDTAGQLARITVKPGDQVKKDQVFAWIDPSRPGMNYSESPVKSPIQGTVTAVYGRVGGMAAAQAPLISVGNLSSLKARTYVPERFTSRITMGMPGILEFETFPGEQFTARVTEMSPVVDPVSRTMEVRMDLTGPLKKVKAGMFAEISLVLAVKPQAVRVPSSCVVNRFGETFVFTVTDDRVKMQPVTPGISENGITEITRGLEADTEIVYQGMNLLEDNSRIRIINQLETLN